MAREVILYIQPAFSYSTGKVEYAEVLIRGYRGIDSVPKILKFVEVNGIEEVFDLDVLKETIKIIKGKNIEYPIGVNLCSNTASKKGIADKILTELKENNIKTDRIIIELNEKTDFKNQIVCDNVRKLRKNGIKIALDDFGVENANLYSLISSEVDIIKIDRALIDHVSKEREESQHFILKCLLNLCQSLKLKHIVEGIENRSQLCYIRALGYDTVQGYLYEKPKPIIEYLEEN